MQFIDNLEELKLKYEYKLDDISESDSVCFHIGFVCYDGMCSLLKKIDKLITKLKSYKGPKDDIATQTLKEIAELSRKYTTLKDELNTSNYYYVLLIRGIQITYQKSPEIKNIKESTIKIIQGILDFLIEIYIKYDKEIINNINKINDLNVIFNF
jgi:hypothetical protein